MLNINNAESVAQYREEIWAAAEELHKTLMETEREIESLSQSWRDFEYKKFTEQFEEDKKKLRPLCTKMREFESEILIRKEAAIRKYTGEGTVKTHNYTFS